MLDLFKKCHGNNSQSREKINFTSTQLFPLGRLQIKYFNKKMLFIVFNVFKMESRYTYIVCRELKEAIFLSDHHAPSPQNKKSLITLKFLNWNDWNMIMSFDKKERKNQGQNGLNRGQIGQNLWQNEQIL